jgi:diacylglycerol O-acyltransferase / wax synthase
VERLSGLDSTFLYLETPSLHMHVCMAMVFDPRTVPGGYRFERVRDLIGARIKAEPVFRRRLVEVPLRLGHPVWVDDPDFDIEYHVRRAAIPSPGGLRELGDLAGDIAGQQLDRSKPLWEIWVVEGVTSGRIALIAKMHHSTVDGVSGAALLSVLFDLEADPAERPPPDPGLIDDRVPSGIELVAGALVAGAIRPVEIIFDLMRTGFRIFDVRRVRQRHDAGSSGPKAALPLSAPRTSFNAAISRHRRVAFSAIRLDDVKRLKNAMGTTVNDVVLAICAGAIRRFLLDGDELPDRPLVTVVPVSVRADGVAKGSNQVSSMFVQLPTQLDDPLERLSAIRAGTKSAKEEHRALGADILLNWAEYAAPSVFATAARFYTGMGLANRHRPIANVVVSNVPGPDFPLYLSGAELEAGFPLGPVMDGMGVNITIMSYRGVLYWGVIVCREVVPRAWELASAIPPALDELLAAAGIDPATPVSALAADTPR